MNFLAGVVVGVLLVCIPTTTLMLLMLRAVWEDRDGE